MIVFEYKIFLVLKGMANMIASFDDKNKATKFMKALKSKGHDVFMEGN